MNELIQRQKTHLTFFSGFLLVMALLFHSVGFVEFRQLLLATATAIAIVPISAKALQATRMRIFSIELLVTIAVIGALVIGEYMESAIVTFLFLFGDFLEARTLEKTRSTLNGLVDMAPQEAAVRHGDAFVTLPVERVAKGDRIIIRTGQKVPVDGKILSGQASLNESAITGEAVPVIKKAGDHVFSSTVIDNGYIEIAAEKIGSDTTFAKMIELVEDAQDLKTDMEDLLGKFAHLYTPAIVVLAILAYGWTRNFHLAITFLVIACPGALVIGAPVSNVAGIGNGAKKGVLIKGGKVIDRFAKADTVVFDKTGTLTKGQPEVTAIQMYDRHEENELLRMVATAETASEHHLGQTLVKEAKSREIKVGSPERAKVKKGSGLIAAVDGKCLAIGNRKLMKLKNATISEKMEAYAVEREKAGNTAVFAAVDGEIAGIFSIADEIRDDAIPALAEMRRSGMKRFIMLTGDNHHTAQRVAQALGLDEFHAELLPEDKVAFINGLQERGHVVAMAGDGVNDAPAIAAADVGLAMGRGGTDISIETADVVLMADKLMQFAHAYALSKATIRNMKQNLFFAVAIVAVL